MSIFSAPSFYGAADRAIYDAGNYFIPQEQYRGAFNITPPATGTGAAAATGINTVLNQGGGGGGGIPFSGTATDLTTAFQKAVDDRQDRLNNPPSRFLGFNTMRDQELTGADAGFYDTIPQEQTFAGKVQDFLTPQSADDIIARGFEPRVKLGILSNLLPDRFGELPRGDQAFIARNMGYTGPTVFGQDQSGLQKDPFGLNVRSGFGNYAEAVEKQVDRLDDYFGGEKFDKKYGAGTTLEFDEETGQFRFVGTNAAQANKMNKMNLAKYNFYKKQIEQRDADRAAAAAAQAEAERRFAAEGRSDPSDRSRAGASGRRPGSGGNVDRVTSGPGRNVDDTGQAYDSGGREGFGYGLADGGRVPYMMGGLANLVDIYD